MQSKLVGTTVRLVDPLQAVTLEREQPSIVQVPQNETLSITEVTNEVTGLLLADWNGVQLIVFEQDLRVALDGTASRQLPPESSQE